MHPRCRKRHPLLECTLVFFRKTCPTLKILKGVIWMAPVVLSLDERLMIGKFAVIFRPYQGLESIQCNIEAIFSRRHFLCSFHKNPRAHKHRFQSSGHRPDTQPVTVQTISRISCRVIVFTSLCRNIPSNGPRRTDSAFCMFQLHQMCLP